MQKYKINTLFFFNDIFYNKIKNYCSLDTCFCEMRINLILIIVHGFVNGDFNDSNHSQTFRNTQPHLLSCH